MNFAKRKKNEKIFGDWNELKSGGRIYFFEVKGKHNWKAFYKKETDAHEKTIRFWQEIYNEKNKLVEVHEKYPIDKGHKKIK